MDYQKLLYMLEKVRTACKPEHGVFTTWDDGNPEGDHAYCIQLEKDGLIWQYSSEPPQYQWQVS